MNFFFRVSLLLALIGCYSCDKEEIITTDTVKNYDAINLGKTTDTAEEENLETRIRMKWGAYLASMALIRDELAEQFFVDILAKNSQTNTITLKSLLNSDNPFRRAFISEYNYYAGLVICRTYTPSSTPVPSQTPPPTSNPINDNIWNANMYIDLLLDDDFEFYLPNGYDESLDNVKSSAYIESDIAERNLQGYSHFKRCEVEEIVINSNTRGNILILRNFENR